MRYPNAVAHKSVRVNKWAKKINKATLADSERPSKLRRAKMPKMIMVPQYTEKPP